MSQAPQRSRNKLCPCGSGLKYKNCCAGKSEAGAANSSATWGIVLVAIVIGVVGVMAAGYFRDADSGPAPGTAATDGPASVPAPAATPAPWQYDPIANQHWHPGHGHWHQGPPPPESQREQDAPVPGGQETPEPWYYDAENNRYWDPAHGHWHAGPPPPEAQRGGTIPGGEQVIPAEAPETPEAWYYDAENDRYWDPNHGHWHAGSPPFDQM